MRMKLARAEKPLYWVGASKRDLMAMPAPVIRQIGGALSVAQYGGKHPDSKPRKGLGPVDRGPPETSAGGLWKTSWRSEIARCPEWA